jgi:hypothetical protein
MNVLRATRLNRGIYKSFRDPKPEFHDEAVGTLQGSCDLSAPWKSQLLLEGPREL